MSNGRTTLGRTGDYLAEHPGDKIDAIGLANLMDVNRTGTNAAAVVFERVGAVSIDRSERPNLISMTEDQAKQWKAGAFDAALKRLGKAVNVSDIQFGRRSAKALVTEPGAKRPARTLRFGHWDDGAVEIRGLAGSAVTLKPPTVAKLAGLFASLPEGWIDLLNGAAISLQFALNVDGRDKPLQSGEMKQLVDYIEQLPARLVGAMDTPSGRIPMSALKQGTDHRVHRLATPEDD